MNIKTLRDLALSGAAIAALGVGAFSAQAQDVDSVVNEGQQANQVAQQSQQRVDQISEETDGLVAEYRNLSRRIDDIRIYNEQLRRQIASQLQEISNLDESISNIDVIRRQVLPEMIEMVDGLEEFINLDMPFRRSERLDRVADLREFLDSGDISPAEQFRQIMETLQAEAEFGRTMEHYRDTIQHNGEDRQVEVLRIGRVALLYKADAQNTDIVGMWDQNAGEWKTLPSSYGSEIEQGLRFSKKQATAQLLILPVSAPEGN